MTGERVQGDRDHLSFLLPWICKQEKKKRKIGIGEGEAEEKRKSFRRWKPRVDKRRESIKVSLFSSTNCDNFSIAPITVILSLSLSLLPSLPQCKTVRVIIGQRPGHLNRISNRGGISRIISITDCRFVISPIYDISAAASTPGRPSLPLPFSSRYTSKPLDCWNLYRSPVNALSFRCR